MTRPLLVGILALAFLAALFLVPLPMTFRTPGPVHPVGQLIRVTGVAGVQHRGEFLVPTVRQTRATPVLVLSAWLTPDARVVPGLPEHGMAAGGDLGVLRSVAFAKSAAQATMGRAVDFDVESRLEAGFGESGGLILTLEMLSQILGDDLTRGRTVAGTGIVEPNGDLQPVVGLNAKIRGAAREGATIFLYPAESDTPEPVEGVQVVPVPHVQRAFRLLSTLE